MPGELGPRSCQGRGAGQGKALLMSLCGDVPATYLTSQQNHSSLKAFAFGR